MSPSIVGLDLSLTATGTAGVFYPAGDFSTCLLKPPSRFTGHDRMDWLLSEIRELCDLAALVVVEGPSYGSTGGGRQAGHHERAGLWWVVCRELRTRHHRIAVVPPASLKKYATGKGNAGKDEVLLATARRFPAFAGGNDEADALWLAAMGAEHCGAPLVDLPQAQRAAMSGVDWPELDR